MSFARLAHRAWLPTLVVAAFSGPALAVEFADVYEQLLQGDKAQGMWGLASLAQSGDTRAQYVLGVAFIEGKNIERDLVRGYAWVEIAADCDLICTDETAKVLARDARLELGQYLSGQQLLQSERIAETYLRPRLHRIDEARSAAQSSLRTGQDARGFRQHAGCARTPATSHCKQVIGEGVVPACEGIRGDAEHAPVTAGPMTHIVAPKYPFSARQVGAEGRITFLAHVDDTGYICSAIVVLGSDNAEIDRAAMDSVLRWRLGPATTSGVPVESIYEFNITFRLTDFAIGQ